ncbi:MAG: hypothetical protein RR272_01390 [Synergistaceae bacterium]
MSDVSEIEQLKDGRYSFIVGDQRYTLSTPLPQETFSCIVRSVQSAVNELPSEITSQSDRLFLAFMNYVNATNQITEKLSDLTKEDKN